MSELQRPTPPPEKADTEFLRLKEVENALLLLKPTDIRRKDDGTPDMGNYDQITYKVDVHVLDGEHAGKFVKGMFVSGKVLNEQLEPVLEAKRYLAARLKKEDNGRFFKNPTDAEFAVVEAKLKEVRGTEEPPY